MEFSIQIKMNEKLFLKDPELSGLGKTIVREGLDLMNKLGYEDFTFKKLAAKIKTTEATIYRYFENKHKLLLYLFSWYWSYQEYNIRYQLNNIKDSHKKIETIIHLLINDNHISFLASEVDGKSLRALAVSEGSKSYLSKQVNNYNKQQLFKSYKDLCRYFADILLEVQPKYAYPHSLASTVIEISHSQEFFSKNLPALTDFKDFEKDLYNFLESLVFNTLRVTKKNKKNS